MAGDADPAGASVPLSYSFVTTAKAAVDARALAHPRSLTIDIVLDGLALSVALVLVAAGQPLLGLGIGAIAGLSLAGARWRPFQRWLIRRRSGALLGQTLTVTLEDGGVRYTSALGESFVPGDALTEVRFDDASVAFYRESSLTGYLPTEAFPSLVERDRLVDVARARIAAAQPVPARDGSA